MIRRLHILDRIIRALTTWAERIDTRHANRWNDPEEGK